MSWLKMYLAQAYPTGWEPGPDCRVSGMPFYPTYTKGVLRKKVRFKYKIILYM